MLKKVNISNQFNLITKNLVGVPTYKLILA